MGRLVDRARERATGLGDIRRWRERLLGGSPPTPLGKALDSAHVSVIAEFKRRSPSRGVLDASMDAAVRSRQYAEAGAAALSVLTEPSEFGGSPADLQAARASTALPVLRKDFHVHPVQLWEARAFGASAALLIMRALGPDDTGIMADAAREAGLEAVFEVRDDSELAWAMDSGARFVGVNRRNLETLEMEDGVIEAMLPAIPPFVLAIAESGVSSRTDVERLADLGPLWYISSAWGCLVSTGSYVR